MEVNKDWVVQFLEFLASDWNVTANTLRIALNTLMFLYSQIFEQPGSNMSLIWG